MSAQFLRRAAGFTLIELLVVVALAAIVASIAVPSFTGMIARNRMEGRANELVADLQFARSEAVARNAPVGVFIGTDCYTIYVVGSTAASSCTALGTGATALKSVTSADIGSGLSMTVFTPIFEPTRGSVSASTADLYTDLTSTATAGTLRVGALAVGRVRLCSPAGTYPGVASC